MLIARVRVNTVAKGDLAVVRDARGRMLVPRVEFEQWRIAGVPVAIINIAGEDFVDVASVPGLAVAFDAANVTLDITVAARALPATTVNLGPERRSNVRFPAETSVFLNYGVDVAGDEDFSQRRTTFATEFAARTGAWLFYNTTSHQWGGNAATGLVRLLTSVQGDDRPNLRRLTVGDYFTPGFELNDAVPLGGVSLSKLYSMDPYFVQYPTAAFNTEIAFPSTVQVRIDGNLVAQRQVPPGPLAITNVTNGITGGHNVSVVIRDPFGREQTLQRPFFFATTAGLAEGLHEYSYNAGFLRRQYGVESNDYGDLAASGFHRYALTDQWTLGARGQATRGLYNFGPFGTWQSAWGIVGAGVAVGGQDGSNGAAGSVAYSYTGANFSLNLGTLYRERNYAQLADLVSSFRIRSNQYASGSIFQSGLGTLTATWTGISSYDGPDTKIANLSYTRGVFDGKGLFSVGYLRTAQPQTSWSWLVSLRYFFDVVTSAVASVGGANGGNTQALSLQRSIPQGEGVGYELTAGRFASDAPDALFGRAFAQVNAVHVSFGGEHARASRIEGGPGLSRLFVAGSVGAVDGRGFAARPVQDSFSLVRVPGLAGVPVYANGWFVGNTDDAGEVVATNIASYYDNYIAFGTREVPLDYVFQSSEIVIAPPIRSGTLVAFDIRRTRAIVGTLAELREGQQLPLEFRELRLVRGNVEIKSFTARRGEFYVEGLEPGRWELRQETGTRCVGFVDVPEMAQAVTDVGAIVCAPP